MSNLHLQYLELSDSGNLAVAHISQERFYGSKLDECSMDKDPWNCQQLFYHFWIETWSESLLQLKDTIQCTCENLKVPIQPAGNVKWSGQSHKTIFCIFSFSRCLRVQVAKISN